MCEILFVKTWRYPEVICVPCPNYTFPDPYVCRRASDHGGWHGRPARCLQRWYWKGRYAALSAGMHLCLYYVLDRTLWIKAYTAQSLEVSYLMAGCRPYTFQLSTLCLLCLSTTTNVDSHLLLKCRRIFSNNIRTQTTVKWSPTTYARAKFLRCRTKKEKSRETDTVYMLWYSIHVVWI